MNAPRHFFPLKKTLSCVLSISINLVNPLYLQSSVCLVNLSDCEVPQSLPCSPVPHASFPESRPYPFKTTFWQIISQSSRFFIQSGRPHNRPPKVNKGTAVHIPTNTLVNRSRTIVILSESEGAIRRDWRSVTAQPTRPLFQP